MAKMKIAKKDRAQVKAECLRMLVTLRLDPAKTRLVSKFVDIYLRLDRQEEQMFQTEIDRMDLAQKEQIMQITTSWEEKGIELGRRQEGRSLVTLLLNQKFGTIHPSLTEGISSLSLEQLEALAIALLNFTSVDDLTQWLDTNNEPALS